MGSKIQRQNQHRRRLKMKIKKWKAKEKDTSRLEKELGYCTGELDRPAFLTGRDCDPRLKKWKRPAE